VPYALLPAKPSAIPVIQALSFEDDWTIVTVNLYPNQGTARLSVQLDKSRGQRQQRPTVDPAGAAVRALLLQAFYTVRSERQLTEQLDYNLLFRWFVGLSADDRVWDATVFCKNRDRLLAGDIAANSLTAC
jgi:transposase